MIGLSLPILDKVEPQLVASGQFPCSNFIDAVNSDLMLL
jgi:hypothetical protein